MAALPYFGFSMKMTMHIDEDVLDRVMTITGAKTKTAAVEIALKEMARRHKMKELFSAGLSAEDLRDAYDPASLAVDSQGLKAAEKQAPYGKVDPTGQ